MLAPAYLEGTYSEVYPDKSEDDAGMRRFFKEFPFPGGIGSHCRPETPGSIHEGGELGYSVSHAFGAAFDNPNLLVAVMVGDGEAETGPLATAAKCLGSTDLVNVIVCDKQKHLQYLDMDAAIKHCAKGIGIREWASNDAGSEPDVVMACAGDIPTKEALAATVLLREHFPDLKVRFINVVDLYTLVPAGEHPHGLADRDFDSLFTLDKPVIFNFHGYPWLIHRLACRRTNHDNMHVRGYKEKVSINTPLELAIENEIDRFSLAIDVINRVPELCVAGAHVKQKLRDMQIDCRDYAHEHGVDQPEADAWVWPY